MKRLFQLLAVASFGLALGSCDKSEPKQNGNQGGNLGEPQRFELSSSLGSVGIQSISSNTNEAEDDLRATLHFKGTNNVAKTTLKAKNFGKKGNLKAYWGVIYGNNENAVEVCKDAVTTEPANPNALTESTVYFQGTETSTIQSKRIKMYAVDNVNLSNITKAIMLLDGKAEGSKVHFTKAKGCDPNERIEGVAKDASQEGRHIPIMTELKDINDMKPSSPNNKDVKFTPRGSLIGLCLMNKTGGDMIVTGIVVPKSGALDFAGSFDWSKDGKPSFTKDYGTDTESALVFPVYQNSTATDKGYTIKNNNVEAPCFFVWGFQAEAKKGQPFQVQIRYKTASNSTEKTTRTFTVYAPTSKIVTTEKKFDDGYAYNVVLTINESNNTGGSEGTDWGNGDTLPNDSDNPYYPFSISQKNTPLDYVAEAPAINKVGTGFVLNHNTPAIDVIADMLSNEVGYYTFDEAVEMFEPANKPAFLKNYVLPTKEQWQAIFPSQQDPVCIPVKTKQMVNNSIPLTEKAQVGSEAIQEYQSEYISKEENGQIKTYALRFKGTKWESAWYYARQNFSFKNTPLVIKCILVKGQNLSLGDIADDTFFEGKAVTVRTLPNYASVNITTPELSAILWRGEDPNPPAAGYYFSSTLAKDNKRYYHVGFGTEYSSVNLNSLNTITTRKMVIRPFYKQLP